MFASVLVLLKVTSSCVIKEPADGTCGATSTLTATELLKRRSPCSVEASSDLWTGLRLKEEKGRWTCVWRTLRSKPRSTPEKEENAACRSHGRKRKRISCSLVDVKQRRRNVRSVCSSIPKNWRRSGWNRSSKEWKWSDSSPFVF